MERKLNCESAAAALSAMIPLGLAKADSLFSLHDPRDAMAESLVIGMKLPHVATGNEGHVICGPLNADQAAVLGVVGCMTNFHIDVISPMTGEYADGGEAVVAAANEDAVADFVHELEDTLGVPLAVEDGVIGVAEADTVGEFAAAIEDAFGLTPQEAELTAVFAGAGISPDDFICLTASELTGLVGGRPVDLRLSSDGFYQSAEVDADMDLAMTEAAASAPLSSDEAVDQLLRDQIIHGVSIEQDGKRIAPDQFFATAGTTQCFPPSYTDDNPALDNTGTIDFCGYYEEPASYEPERSSILVDAAVTVTGERQNQYGEPEDSLARIAAYWSVYLKAQPGAELTPKDVAMMMVLLKIARAENGYHRDNYVDAAGYIGIAGEAELNAVTTPTTSKRTVH